MKTLAAKQRGGDIHNLPTRPFLLLLTATPRRWTAIVATVWRRIVQGARIAWSIVTAPFDFYCWMVKGLFGGSFDDGEIVDPCPLCSDPSSKYIDGHAPGEQCPRAMVADCADCLCVVALTRFGFCSIGGAKHFIVNRRPKPPHKTNLHIVKE